VEVRTRSQVLASGLAYAGLALACAYYFEERTKVVPKWGQWYMASEGHPYVLLQVRAFLHGHLALLPHPSGASNDYVWGRGGMHSPFGLGLPILATPFHLLGLAFHAPGFPDSVRFLVLYALTTVLLVWALHRSRWGRPNGLGASMAATGFVMVFPTFVGLVQARFLIYEQAIATGALWCVGLLAGVLLLLDHCTLLRLCSVCAAAGFAAMIRPPLAIYGLVSATFALLIAHRKGLGWRPLSIAALAFASVMALYFVANTIRFGAPLSAGYEAVIGGPFVNRMARWGLPYSKLPFRVAAKELYATLFLLDPVPTQIMMGAPPEAVRPYAIGERWREYYSPTFDEWILAAWVLSLGAVVWRVVRGRLWRSDRPLDGEVATLIGAWALPPVVVLFFFYARVGTIVTRYFVDMYPAFAAACLCFAMTTVDALRKYAPQRVGSVQIAFVFVAGLYISGWRGWASGLASSVDEKTILARIATIDAMTKAMPAVPDHFKCNEERGPSPVHTHLHEWAGDCSFPSGMVFAMPHQKCVSFTLAPRNGQWDTPELQALAGFRANADYDALVSCGKPTADGELRRLTMCDPRSPPFLVDGLRLYSIATLDEGLNAIDNLKLMRIDAAESCPN
jgi:hypothetical protein